LMARRSPGSTLVDVHLAPRPREAHGAGAGVAANVVDAGAAVDTGGDGVRGAVVDVDAGKAIPCKSSVAGASVELAGGVGGARLCGQLGRRRRCLPRSKAGRGSGCLDKRAQ